MKDSLLTAACGTGLAVFSFPVKAFFLLLVFALRFIEFHLFLMSLSVRFPMSCAMADHLRGKATKKQRIEAKAVSAIPNSQKEQPHLRHDLLWSKRFVIIPDHVLLVLGP